jgi:hypothetical protein
LGVRVGPGVGVGFRVGSGVGVGFRVGAGVVAGWVGRAVGGGGDGVCTMRGLPFGPGADADGSSDGSDDDPPDGSTDGPPEGSVDGAIDENGGSEPPAPLVGWVVGSVVGPSEGPSEGGADASAVVGPGRALATAICPGRVGATTPAVSATVARMRFKSPMATTKRAR